MTRNEEYLNTIITALGGDPSKIPPYTFESEDNLAYLAKAFEGVTPGGGGGGVLVVNVDAQTYTCDKTALEMYQAAQSGLVLLRTKIESDGVVVRDQMLPVIQVSMNASSEEKYIFITYGDSAFIGATDNSYPVPGD